MMRSAPAATGPESDHFTGPANSRFAPGPDLQERRLRIVFDARAGGRGRERQAPGVVPGRVRCEPTRCGLAPQRGWYAQAGVSTGSIFSKRSFMSTRHLPRTRRLFIISIWLGRSVAVLAALLEAPRPLLAPVRRRIHLLTEGEVSRSWQKLFKSGNVTAETFERADLLLDELRGTSPLRHRLQSELEELRKIHADKLQAVEA